MQSPLDLYESQLQLVTEVCADPWFAEQLVLSRRGDADATRRISGSCLRLVLEIAKRRWRPEGMLSQLEFVEEGNVVLIKTIRKFTGNTAPEFLKELRQNVESWYTALLEHPAWARDRRDSYGA